MTNKPVKIVPDNRGIIEAMLEAVNGRASSFTVTDYRVVEAVASETEKRLEGLPKAERVGARASWHPAGPSAKRYKYRAVSTGIALERRATGWYLTGASRTEVRPNEPAKLAVYITEAQAAEIARRAVAGFIVMAHA
jgi:hypothetical protein